MDKSKIKDVLFHLEVGIENNSEVELFVARDILREMLRESGHPHSKQQEEEGVKVKVENFGIKSISDTLLIRSELRLTTFAKTNNLTYSVSTGNWKYGDMDKYKVDFWAEALNDGEGYYLLAGLQFTDLIDGEDSLTFSFSDYNFLNKVKDINIPKINKKGIDPRIVFRTNNIKFKDIENLKIDTAVYEG